MKKLTLALFVAGLMVAPLAQAGNDKDCAQAKACCAKDQAQTACATKSTAACPKAKAASTAKAIKGGAKGAQLLAIR